MKDDIQELIEQFLPSDTADQAEALGVISRVKAILDASIQTVRILDLGAGTGDSYEPLTRAWPGSEWLGLDIESSPEVDSRSRSDIRFETYDGRRFPLPDRSFDVVFSKQVLEHVRHPDDVVSEVSRVLKPGGVFFGSVSQLEPYHSFSIFNWTIFGIIEVFQAHGLRVRELRPGIDGMTLILRRLFGKPPFRFMFGVDESVLNHLIGSSERGRRGDGAVKIANLRKLLVAGHVVFIAQKAPDD